MMIRTLVPVCLLAAAAALPAQTSRTQGALLGGASSKALPPLTGVFHTPDGTGGLDLHVQAFGLAGPRFQIQALLPEMNGALYFLGEYPLDAQGQGGTIFPVSDPSIFPDNLGVLFRAVYEEDGETKFTPPASLVLNQVGCAELDFDRGFGGLDLPAGTPIADQWTAVGLDISCTTTNILNPELCILFDSDPAVAGGSPDPDLQTPGPGPNNDTELGMLLILAENDADQNGDGLVDVPDDAAGGGIIHFDFAEPTTVCTATFVDIDPAPGAEQIWQIVFYSDLGNTMIGTINVPPLGNNSVLQMFFDVDLVRRMDVEFGGSGGLASIATCPIRVDFDQTTYGIPFELEAGTMVSDQFAEQGLTIAAQSAFGNLDTALLFDTANRTGGDTDLVTPGPGVGNDVAERMALIVAENVVDANGDGLVDDPDDALTGGDLLFNFDFDVELLSITVLDVDGIEQSYAEAFDALGNSRGITPFAILGDNSKQVVPLEVEGVRQLVVHFGGSGAVTDLRFCPDS